MIQRLRSVALTHLRALRVKRFFSSTYLIALTIGFGIVLCLLTVLSARALHIANQDMVEVAIERRKREDALEINRAMSAHSQALLSSVGLMNSVRMTPEVWGRFIASYRSEDAFPAMFAIGAAEYIRSENIPELEARLSDQYQRPVEVFPRPTGEFSEPVLYVERGDSLAQQTIGLDMMQLPERNEAAELATDTNSIVLTDPAHIISDTTTLEEDPRSAIFMFAPYYVIGSDLSTVEKRQRAIRGHVYIAFHTQELFSKIFSENNFNNIRLVIYQKDDPEKDLLYASPNISAHRRQQNVKTDLTLLNKTYTLEYQFNAASILSPVQRYAPLLTLLFGLTISIVLPALMHNIVRARQNALHFANEQKIKKAQDELLSLASHQLRTPATATKQYIGMVLQGFMGDVPKEQQAFLQKAYDSNERQLRIINDILHVAKLDAGRIVPSMKPFDITATVKGVLEDTASDVRKAGITIRRQLGRSYMLTGDEYMIRMIVENLVSNAIKYTPSGGKVTVAARREAHGYHLSVTDTGIGIAKQDFDRLFKQFSRIESDHSATVPGSGVGLYLAQNLAHLHGGKIKVVSKIGKGSTFTLYLPKNM